MIVQRYVVDRISFILTKDKSTLRHPPPILRRRRLPMSSPHCLISRSENGRIRTRRPLIVSHNPPFPVHLDPSSPFPRPASSGPRRRRRRPSVPTLSICGKLFLPRGLSPRGEMASEGLCGRHAPTHRQRPEARGGRATADEVAAAATPQNFC